jgi:hypothetical protein
VFDGLKANEVGLPSMSELSLESATKNGNKRKMIDLHDNFRSDLSNKRKKFEEKVMKRLVGFGFR